MARAKELVLKSGVNHIDITDVYRNEDLNLRLVSAGARIDPSSMIYIADQKDSIPFAVATAANAVLYLTDGDLRQLMHPKVYYYNIRSYGVVIARGRVFPAPMVGSW